MNTTVVISNSFISIGDAPGVRQQFETRRLDSTPGKKRRRAGETAHSYKIRCVDQMYATAQAAAHDAKVNVDKDPEVVIVIRAEHLRQTRAQVKENIRRKEESKRKVRAAWQVILRIAEDFLAETKQNQSEPRQSERIMAEQRHLETRRANARLERENRRLREKCGEPIDEEYESQLVRENNRFEKPRRYYYSSK